MFIQCHFKYCRKKLHFRFLTGFWIRLCIVHENNVYFTSLPTANILLSFHALIIWSMHGVIMLNSMINVELATSCLSECMLVFIWILLTTYQNHCQLESCVTFHKKKSIHNFYFNLKPPCVTLSYFGGIMEVLLELIFWWNLSKIFRSAISLAEICKTRWMKTSSSKWYTEVMMTPPRLKEGRK